MAPSFRGNFVESLSGEVSNPSGDLFLERTRNCLDKEIKSKGSDHFFQRLQMDQFKSRQSNINGV